MNFYLQQYKPATELKTMSDATTNFYAANFRSVSPFDDHFGEEIAAPIEHSLEPWFSALKSKNIGEVARILNTAEAALADAREPGEAFDETLESFGCEFDCPEFEEFPAGALLPYVRGRMFDFIMKCATKNEITTWLASIAPGARLPGIEYNTRALVEKELKKGGLPYKVGCSCMRDDNMGGGNYGYDDGNDYGYDDYDSYNSGLRYGAYRDYDRGDGDHDYQNARESFGRYDGSRNCYNGSCSHRQEPEAIMTPFPFNCSCGLGRFMEAVIEETFGLR